MKNITLAVGLWALLVGLASAQTCPIGPNGIPNVAVSGNLSTIYGTNAANQRVMYQWGMTQQPGNFTLSTIPGGSSCSVFTDANGNLPTPPATCACFPQGASGYITIGSGQPARVIFPNFAAANISTILPVNAAMDPIVSEIDLCGSPTDINFAVSNPPVGTIGPATLCPGDVTGLQGIPICTTPPVTGQDLQFNGTTWCPSNGPGGTSDLGIINVITDFGAKGDLRGGPPASSTSIVTGAAVASSVTLTCATCAFITPDVGKEIYVEGAAPASNMTTAAATAFSITAISDQFGTWLITTSVASGFIAGNQVTIAATTNYNGTFTVNSASGTSFTIIGTAGLSNESSGTASIALTLRSVQHPTTTLVAGTISFVAPSGGTPAKINDSANGLAIFAAGDEIKVVGSAGNTNDSTWQIISSSAASLSVGLVLKTTIAGVTSATVATLGTAATHTTTASVVWIGTNDYADAQAALNSVPVTGATVVFPCEHNYLLDGGPLIPISHTNIRAGCSDAAQARPRLLAGSANPLIQFSPAHGPQINLTNIGVSGLDTDGNNAEYPPAVGGLAGFQNACIAAFNGTLNNLTIDHNTIENCASWGVIIDAGTDGGSAGSAFSDNYVRIEDNQVQNTDAHGIIAQGWVNHVWIDRNEVKNFGLMTTLSDPGITCCRYGIEAHVDENTVRSILATGNQNHGVSLDMTANVEAHGNDINGTQGYGIEVGFNSNASVTGNTIQGAALSGIGISGSSGGQTVTDVSTTLNSGVLTSASAIFHPAMRGRGIRVTGCGHTGTGNYQTGNVLTVTSTTSITTDISCAATQINATAHWEYANSNVSITGNTVLNSGVLQGGGILSFVATTDGLSTALTCTASSTTISVAAPFNSIWGTASGFTKDMVGQSIAAFGCGTNSPPFNVHWDVIAAVTNATTATMGTKAEASAVAVGQLILEPVFYNQITDGTTTTGAGGVNVSSVTPIFQPSTVGAGFIATGAGAGGNGLIADILNTNTTTSAVINAPALTAVAGSSNFFVESRMGFNQGVDVSGNTVRGSPGNGILIDNSYLTSVTNNIVSDSVQSGIFFFLDNYVSLGGNLVYANSNAQGGYYGIETNQLTIFGLAFFETSQDPSFGNNDGSGNFDKLLLRDYAS